MSKDEESTDISYSRGSSASKPQLNYPKCDKIFLKTIGKRSGIRAFSLFTEECVADGQFKHQFKSALRHKPIDSDVQSEDE